jgi:hypothetical protein
MNSTLLSLALLLGPTTAAGAPPAEKPHALSVSGVAWRVGFGMGLALVASSGLVGQRATAALHAAAPRAIGDDATPLVLGVAATGVTIGALSAIVGSRIESER